MAEFLEQLLKAGSTVSFVICNGEVGVRSYEAGKAEMTFLMMAFFLKRRFPSQQKLSSSNQVPLFGHHVKGLEFLYSRLRI